MHYDTQLYIFLKGIVGDWWQNKISNIIMQFSVLELVQFFQIVDLLLFE